MQPIILCDIPSKLQETIGLPILRRQGLPFRTEWVEYPDVARVMQNIGAKQSTIPNTGATVTESFAIAEYLDKTYPEKPMAEVLNPRSREEGYEKKWEEFSPEGPRREADWKSLMKTHDIVNGWYEKSNGRWIMGDTFSYADIIVAAEVFWYKRVFHEAEWGRI
ncbi:hypothetical protein BJ138DRAFT_1136819 [Hygrophoropsis aurantiaca]|uniref:Uncharacterized protein n=1 Tax=Hygrophoropsis aurantiaca TaxID=72124 RepID=A0ACB8A7I2_9AGAM|nr:hypothetical protein BJ138DRAFT_1136819 [Hygrophoropsis aurantiaca]